jgi:hypothetical protein
MLDVDSMLVAWIRQKCAREFGMPRETFFFSAHHANGETEDETILRVFREEREAHGEHVSDDEVLDIMIHG